MHHNYDLHQIHTYIIISWLYKFSFFVSKIAVKNDDCGERNGKFSSSFTIEDKIEAYFGFCWTMSDKLKNF